MRRKDDRKQQSIKEALLKLILSEGLQGASIAKIAREAGVSPATVYIYYDNKEAMLQDTYREYQQQMRDFLTARVQRDMSGEQLIDTLVRSYYTYITRHGEVFYFVEQFSSCPALTENWQTRSERLPMEDILNEFKRRRVLKDVDNTSIHALLFNPVKTIAVRYHDREAGTSPMLEDLIKMIQAALLR
ncbi:MAG: TetR/AcrR family transcriptional regulator [Syntrophomonadaceae bacterium]